MTGGNAMIMNFMKITIVLSLLLSSYGTVGASWGWDSTDDPTPYYHQKWGKWYCDGDGKVFMVQIDDKTYKYVFDYTGQFIGGWMTYMPMRLN